MSDELDLIFHGESAKECDDFIRAVRKHARVNRKTRDNDWIAEEVYDAFSGKALRWYLDQTPEVQGDWTLLQKALLDRWAENGESDDRDGRRHSGVDQPSAPPSAAGPVPAPPAAASSGVTNNLSGKIGRLRIRTGLLHTNVKFLSKTYYSGQDSWRQGSFLATSDLKSAMQAPPSGRKLLAGYFTGPWKASYGFLVGVDVPTGSCLNEHDSTYYGNEGEYQFRAAVWGLQDERYLSLVWSENENDAVKIEVPTVWAEEDGIYFRYHGTSGWANKQVEFEFEALKD